MSASTVPDLPVWAQWFAALAVPIAASFGVLIGLANLRLNRRRRMDELFDRRYAFYQEFASAACRLENWRHENALNDSPYDPPTDEEFLNDWSDRALFLFGRRTSEKIQALDFEVCLEIDDHENFVTTAAFRKPFEKQMVLAE